MIYGEELSSKTKEFYKTVSYCFSLLLPKEMYKYVGQKTSTRGQTLENELYRQL
jgi:hypothetical protein